MQAVERFCAAPVRTDGAELAEDMPAVRRCADLLELKFSEMAAAFARTDEYDNQGSVSPIHWIRHRCHMGGGAAADRLAVGELLEELPQSVQATAEGEIGFAHLALIARTATAIAASGTNRQLDEDALLAKARELSVGRFRDQCYHARHAADLDAYVAGEIRAVEARMLTITTGDEGFVHLRGTFDPEGGAAIRTALEPLAKRNGKDDERELDRRMADALIELASHALDTGQVRSRPHLQVTTTLETLLQRCGAPAADMHLSLPISAKAVERLACDCNITRFLLASDSTVIDVGRSKRTATNSQRRALNARDRGCRWPGCDRPATWSSAHHIVHWPKNGPTDLSNLVLLCWRHHWNVHEGGWQLVKSDDGRMLTVPPRPAPNSLAHMVSLARGPDPSGA
jgi:Domain of unknown function (DUF222)/HNH endonuclease